MVAQYLPFLKELIQHEDNQAETLLHSAVREDNIELVKSLISMGADPYKSNHLGVTPLHIAIMNQSPQCDCVLWTLSQYPDWDWNYQDSEKNTYLHLVAQAGRGNLVDDLPEDVLNRSIIQENKHGETPLSLAVKAKHWDFVVKLFESIKDKKTLTSQMFHHNKPLIKALPVSASLNSKEERLFSSLWKEFFSLIKQSLESENEISFDLAKINQVIFPGGNNILQMASLFKQWPCCIKRL